MARKRSSVPGYRSGGQKYTNAWYRTPAGSVTLSGSATEYDQVQLVNATSVMRQEAAAAATTDIILERQAGAKTLLLRRILLRVAVRVVAGAANEFIRIMVGLYLRRTAGTTLEVVDPYLIRGTAAQKEAFSSVDWLWQEEHSCTPSVAGTTYSLEQLVGEPWLIDVSPRRTLGDQDVLCMAVGMTGVNLAALNPGTQVIVNPTQQLLFGLGRGF